MPDIMGPDYPYGTFANAHSRHLDPPDEEDEDEEGDDLSIHAKVQLEYLLTNLRDDAWLSAESYWNCYYCNEIKEATLRGVFAGAANAFLKTGNKLAEILEGTT